MEKSTNIKSVYFDPAAKFATGLSTSAESQKQECAAIYHQYALFCERQYHAIARSPDALRWKFYAERKMEEYKQRIKEYEALQLPKNDPRRQMLGKQVTDTNTLLQKDRASFEEHITSRDNFLIKAIEMYSLSLATSDHFDDDSTIRLCSLWFSNFEYRDDANTFQASVGEALRRVPSHKFVFLAHQITARMSDKPSSAKHPDQENLQDLILRMCRDHPFHSLYQVWCLQSEQKTSSSSSSRRQSSRANSPSSQVARANAAGSIFDRLRTDGEFAKCVRDIEKLCSASLEWAAYPIRKKFQAEKTTKGPKEVPSGIMIRKIHHLRVPVITVHTPLDPTARYENCVWVESFEGTFKVLGGQSLPKVTNCLGSDGQKYGQLVSSFEVFCILTEL